MAGIHLWRCTRCRDHVAAVVDRSTLLCGDCFYRQTVERIMAAAFLPDAVSAAFSTRPVGAGSGTSAPTR